MYLISNFWRSFECKPLLTIPCYAVVKNRGCKIKCPNNFLPKLQEKTKIIPVAELKVVAWKSRYEFLKMRGKRPFSNIARGIAAEGLHSRGWKCMWRFFCWSSITYNNLGRQNFYFRFGIIHISPKYLIKSALFF